MRWRREEERERAVGLLAVSEGDDVVIVGRGGVVGAIDSMVGLD